LTRADAASANIEIVRSAQRFRTRTGWLDSRHSFSFGAHYDPGNTHFGLLLVSNDDIVAPGAGFPAHPHRDMEIVTWVLGGALAHSDSAGRTGTVRAGLVQRMSAGTGIRHAELNARQDQPVRFVQMWVAPDAAGVEPGYEQCDVAERLAGGDLIPLASGRGHAGAATIGQRDAVLYAARLLAGRTVPLPQAPFLHLYLARGQVSLGEERLGAGDAARIRGGSAPAVAAAGSGSSEILVWEMYSHL
jgi:hypothetical protein